MGGGIRASEGVSRLVDSTGVELHSQGQFRGLRFGWDPVGVGSQVRSVGKFTDL